MYTCVLAGFISGYSCFVKQQTAYEMLISYWSSDVCSSDLELRRRAVRIARRKARVVDQTLVDRTHDDPDIDPARRHAAADRKSGVKGKSVAVRVVNGGSRFIAKKTIKHTKQNTITHEPDHVLNRDSK